MGSKTSASPKKTIAAAAKQPAPAPKAKGKAPPAKANGAAAKASADDDDDDEDEEEGGEDGQRVSRAHRGLLDRRAGLRERIADEPGLPEAAPTVVPVETPRLSSYEYGCAVAEKSEEPIGIRNQLMPMPWPGLRSRPSCLAG